MCATRGTVRMSAQRISTYRVCAGQRGRSGQQGGWWSHCATFTVIRTHLAGTLSGKPWQMYLGHISDLSKQERQQAGCRRGGTTLLEAL
jgi:hypothetical protein